MRNSISYSRWGLIHAITLEVKCHHSWLIPWYKNMIILFCNIRSALSQLQYAHWSSRYQMYQQLQAGGCCGRALHSAWPEGRQCVPLRSCSDGCSQLAPWHSRERPWKSVKEELSSSGWLMGTHVKNHFFLKIRFIEEDPSYCMRVEGADWAPSRLTAISSALGCGCDVAICCCDFPVIMDNNPELWAQVKPLISKLLRVWAFYHRDRNKPT